MTKPKKYADDLEQQAERSHKLGYEQGVDDAIKVVMKFFANDWTAVDAFKALSKLKEENENCE